MPEIQDKKSQPIKEGDEVWTKIRGGKREGTVEEVVTSEKQAKEADVKNPPKVSRHPTDLPVRRTRS